VHIVDISGSEARNPIEDFEKINAELSQYSPQLALRPQIVVANKTDMIFDEKLAEQFENYIKEKGLELFKISALTQKGVRELLFSIYDRLQTLPPIEIYESQPLPVEMIIDGKDKSFEVTVHDGVYIVEGAWLINVLGSINFEDYESLQYLQRILRNNGVFDKLVELGIQDGDTVSIYDIEFDYVP
jgi:GTP-binding protein